MSMSAKITPVFSCLVLLLILSTQQGNGQLSAAQNYARNRPGVVMVKTNFSATIYLKQIVLNSRLFNVLLDSISHLENYGTPLNAEEKLDIVLKEISNKPSVFFKNTSDYRYHTQNIATSGTGFLISDDGYVVTNCHVVDEAGTYIRRKFILSAFQQVTASNIAALEAAWAVSFRDEQKELLYNTFAKVYSSIQSILLENLKKNIYVIYATDTVNGHTSSRITQARIITKGQSMPGKDVAILKIESGKPLPTVALSEIILPRIGDRVYVFGYPDPITTNEYLSAESVLEPSLTSGIISGIRKTTTGWNVVQMDADINHGNSGGPVCSENGNVIGIATFGSIEYGSGRLAAGMNFSLPISIVKDFLDSLKIEPKRGKASLQFNEAMIDYDKAEFREAVKKLKRLQKINPDFPGISYYMADCTAKIKSGQDKTERKMRLGLVVGGLFVSLIVLLWIRKKLIRRNASIPS